MSLMYVGRCTVAVAVSMENWVKEDYAKPGQREKEILSHFVCAVQISNDMRGTCMMLTMLVL